MAQRHSELSGIADAVLKKSATRHLNMGQVICLGMEDLRERLGEKRWASSEILIKKTIDEVVDRVLGDGDSFVRARDGSVVIVFGSDDPAVAEARAARIAEEVREGLFGTEAGGELTFSHVVQSHDGLAPGEQRDPAGVLKSLMARARRVSMLEGRGRQDVVAAASRDSAAKAEPSAAEATGEPERKTARDLDAAARLGVTGPDLPQEDRHRSGIKRSGEIRDRLIREFEDLEQTEIAYGFRPVWVGRSERVPVFESVAMRPDPLGGRLILGSSVLGPGHGPADRIELDLAALEHGLLAHSRALRQGSRQLLTVSADYETLSDQVGHRELNDLLSRAPMAIRKTVALQLTNLPQGVPESRLAELTYGLRDCVKTFIARVDLARLRELQPNLLSRFRSVGVSTIVADLPPIPKAQDCTGVSALVTSTQKLGMNVAVSGITAPKMMKALLAKGGAFFSGSLVGGPFWALPRAYQLKVEDIWRPTNMALAHAKCAPGDIETWCTIAENMGIAFFAARVDAEGCERFTYLAGNFEELTGYKPEELHEAPVTILQPDDVNRKAASTFVARIRSAGEATIRLRTIKKDGTPQGILFRALQPFHRNGSDGETVFFAFAEPCPVPGQRKPEGPGTRIVDGVLVEGD